MNQAAALLDLFRANGNKLTLKQILENLPVVGSKYTGRISEIREMGYTIDCIQDHEHPMENIYVLHDKPFYDLKGQSQMSLGQ